MISYKKYVYPVSDVKMSTRFVELFDVDIYILVHKSSWSSQEFYKLIELWSNEWKYVMALKLVIWCWHNFVSVKMYAWIKTGKMPVFEYSIFSLQGILFGIGT